MQQGEPEKKAQTDPHKREQPEQQGGAPRQGRPQGDPVNCHGHCSQSKHHNSIDHRANYNHQDLIPAWDNLSDTHRKSERLLPIKTGVKLLSWNQGLMKLLIKWKSG